MTAHPISSDGEIRIRPLQMADVDTIHDAIVESVPEITTWEDWCHEGYRRADTASWLHRQLEAQRRGSRRFVIEDVASGAILGSVGLSRIDARLERATIGYWVRTSWTGRGVATRAAFLAARFGFEQLGLVRILITAALDNTASRRVAERIGAHFEGVLHHGLMIHGEARDAALYSMTRDDLARFPSPSGA
ncbi:MAG: GNAT family protein [Acidimicrobiia bacterium]|jgi:RimJ/RimL family protein N-acetyltransferase